MRPSLPVLETRSLGSKYLPFFPYAAIVNDLATLGQRMRHFRTNAGLTLDQLGGRRGRRASQLSLMETASASPGSRCSAPSPAGSAPGLRTARSRPPERACGARDRARPRAVEPRLRRTRPPRDPRRQGHGATTRCARWSDCTTNWPAARARPSRHRRRPARQHRAARHDARARQPPARDRAARRRPVAQGRAPSGALTHRRRARWPSTSGSSWSTSTTCRTRRGR